MRNEEIAEMRDEVARSVRVVRLACSKRECLKECVRRMVAAAPCPRATRRRWGAAAAAAALVLGAFALEAADIRCVWNGQTYVCAGEGSSVEVIGGGSYPVIVTNVWGTCTNCVMMSPSQCESLKDELYTNIDQARRDFQSLHDFSSDLVDAVQADLDDISTFQRFGLEDAGAAGVSDPEYIAMTNYVFSTANTQTSLCRGFLSFSALGIGLNRARAMSYNNGIYDYAQTMLPTLEGNLNYLNQIKSISETSAERMDELFYDLGNNLDCEQCQAGEGDLPGGVPGSVATNGNWCTFDQGQAIKTLLRDLNTWAERQHDQLFSISNSVEQSFNALRDGFFTSYTAIPTEEDLGSTWQELYLEGYSPNFHEYAATNILARIELLLAGMSGVLTNNTDFAAAGDFAEGGMEATNRFETVVSDFTNEVGNVIQTREQNVRSVGDALIGLYNVFRQWSGTPFSRTTLIGSYSIEIGEQHWDVPTFEPSERGLALGNLIRVVCRSVMSVIYILFTVMVLVRFSMAYFEWIWKYVKWGIELMQGLFA